MFNDAVDGWIDLPDFLDTTQSEKIDAFANVAGIAQAWAIIRQDPQHTHFRRVVLHQLIEYAHFTGCPAADIGIIKQGNQGIGGLDPS